MIKGLLFDLDGTLLDSAPDFVYCLNSLLKKYEEENLAFNEINRHSFYKLDYLIRAKEFIQIWENSNKNYQEFASEIRANKKQKHRILLGEEKFSIDRALNEAKSYISEWEKGNVF